MRCRSLLHKGLQWRVGNGTRIKFWWDHWVDNCSLVDLLSLHSTPLSNPDCTVSAFINDDRTWNIQALRHVISDEHVVQKVLGVPLPVSDIEDSFCWGFSGSGNFSVKSATWLAHVHVEPGTPPWEFKWLWKVDASPKILIFLWPTLHNRGEHHRVPGPFSRNRSRSRLNRVLGSGNRSRSRFNQFPVSRTRYRNRLGTGSQPGTRLPGQFHWAFCFF